MQRDHNGKVCASLTYLLIVLISTRFLPDYAAHGFEDLSTEVLVMIMKYVSVKNSGSALPDHRFSAPKLSHHLFKARMISKKIAEVGAAAFKDIVKADPRLDYYCILSLPSLQVGLDDMKTLMRSPFPLVSVVHTIEINLYRPFNKDITRADFEAALTGLQPDHDIEQIWQTSSNTAAVQHQFLEYLSSSTGSTQFAKLIRRIDRTLTLRFSHDHLAIMTGWNANALNGLTGSTRSKSDQQIFQTILSMDVVKDCVYELHLNLFSNSFRARLLDQIRDLPFIRTLQALRIELRRQHSVHREKTKGFPWSDLPSLCLGLRQLQLDLGKDDGRWASRCLVGHHWPHLEGVSLVSFCGDQDVLCQFLLRHRDTLRDLGIYDATRMEENEQIGLLKRLRDMGLSLDSCTFTEDSGSFYSYCRMWNGMAKFKSLFRAFIEARSDLAVETRDVGSYVDGRLEKGHREVALRDPRRERDGTVKTAS